VFVFGDKERARKYAATLGLSARVLTLSLDAENLDPDDESAVLEPAAELIRQWPDIPDETLSHLDDENPWKTAQAHRGPVPIQDVIEEELP
jgi:hypothetical protein